MFETLTALFVLTVALSLLQLNVVETKKVLLAKNQEVDYYLAQRMLRESDASSVLVHDRTYTPTTKLGQEP